MKFLGVLLDSNLNWKPHITELSKTLARTTGVFFKIRHFVPLDALFYPFVSYGIAVWGLTNKTFINTVFIIQKKILKAITFSDMNAHSDPIFSKLGLLKVGDIFQLQLLSFIHDCYHGLAPSYFSSYFTPAVNMHHYNTRAASRGDLFLQRKNTFIYGIRSIQYSGSRLWNTLPVPIRDSQSVSVFRSQVKALFL